MIGYSPTTKGFYDSEIHGNNVPEDMQVITAELHAQLLQDQSNGAAIQPDENGMPVAVWLEPATLEENQASVWDAIKAERDRRTQKGGYKVGEHWYHSDLFSRSQQTGLLLLGANIPAGLKWKTMSGAFVDMTPDLAQQVFAAAAASDTAIFAAAEAHRAAMMEAESPLEYDFMTGWPQTYGEVTEHGHN